MIEFECGKCGKHVRVRDDAAGKRGRCPQCGAVLSFPGAENGVSLRKSEEPTEATQPSRPAHQSSAQGMPAPQPAPLESGHVAQALSVNVHLPKRTSSLGVVSLILGVVAFLFCWVPVLGILSLPLSALGVLLAAIGLGIALVRRGSGIGWPIGGGAVSVLALAIGVAQVAVIGSCAEAITKSSEQGTRTNQQVVGPGPGEAGRGEQAGTSDAGTAPPPPATQEQEWASAKGSVRQGDVELTVSSVFIGKVPVRGGFDDGDSVSEDELLAVQLEIVNRSESKKVEYESWLGRDISFSRDYATLQDNFGNNYRRVSFGFGTEIVGHTEKASIYPGKSLADVLVFQAPVEKAEYLNLELPADNCGGTGMFRLRIPADMIQRR
jgi:hypothetical protein